MTDEVNVRIINDIDFAIREALDLMKRTNPPVYSQLIIPSYNKAIEAQVSHYLYEQYGVDRAKGVYFEDIIYYDIKKEYEEDVKKWLEHYKRSLFQAIAIAESFEESYKKYWADSVITVIDEMGNAEKQSDWPLEILQDLIESRENKASIWISNLSIDDISSIYGNRIASRLSSGTTITFGGKDRRMGG